MGLGHIAVRALAAYVYLLVTTRVSGKRVVSEATPFDLLVSLIVGDLIDDAIWAEVSLARFGAAVAAILFCDAVVKIASFHSEPVHRLVNGRPAVVLRDGAEDRRALRSEQMNESDLAHLLRMKGIDKRDEVHLGLVERDHQLSVIRRPESEPVRKKDAPRVREALR